MNKSIMIENKRAYHEYFVCETLECGIALWGNEVKSIREGKVNIKEAWCRIQDGNLVIRGMHISKFDTANIFDVDEDRERQLLAHKKEISKLDGQVSLNGYSLIPLKVYFANNKCKVLVGLCKGKKNYDKRNTLRDRQVNRDISRAFKEYNKNG